MSPAEAVGAAGAPVLGMVCRECGELSPVRAAHVCESCFGPLDIRYDRELLARTVSRGSITAGPPSMWRYRALLPLAGTATLGQATGMTPLYRSDRLAAALGLREVWVKNEGVGHPSLSFKDRVVAVAMSKARELGIERVACASTGNLANSLAALAASVGMPALILVPHDLERSRLLATVVYGAEVVAVRGTYDDCNRLASELADRHGWGFVNVNLKPFYAEGSKTVGYEIVEQLGWRLPAHTVVPMAGGSLLCKIAEGYRDFADLGLCPRAPARLHGVQAAGCAPIVDMIRHGQAEPTPVKHPHTIARSLAVGSPGDAIYARAAIADSGGYAAAASDEEIIAGMRLLAETTGIFGEAAAGVVVAATRKLCAEGRIGPGAGDDGPVVLVVTGQGLKTQETLEGQLPPVPVIEPRLAAFEMRYHDRGS
jgi:threonine synthase